MELVHTRDVFWPSSGEPPREGPMVRIRLPPADSPLPQRILRLRTKSHGFPPQSMGGLGPEKRMGRPRGGFPARFLCRALMQSHLVKVWTVGNKAKAAVIPRPAIYLWGCGLACEQSALLDPIERQIEFGQTRRGEIGALAALDDHLDELWT